MIVVRCATASEFMMDFADESLSTDGSRQWRGSRKGLIYGHFLGSL
jgi:hypothetical protein